MTPDAVHAFVKSNYSQLVAERRNNPDGWSFFLGPRSDGAFSNRIFRVVANSPNQPSRLKLVVTSRLTANLEFIFRGDESELRKLLDRELQLYKQHFQDLSR